MQNASSNIALCYRTAINAISLRLIHQRGNLYWPSCMIQLLAGTLTDNTQKQLVCSVVRTTLDEDISFALYCCIQRIRGFMTIIIIIIIKSRPVLEHSHFHSCHHRSWSCACLHTTCRPTLEFTRLFLDSSVSVSVWVGQDASRDSVTLI